MRQPSSGPLSELDFLLPSSIVLSTTTAATDPPTGRLGRLGRTLAGFHRGGAGLVGVALMLLASGGALLERRESQ